MPDRTRPLRKEICLNEQELNLIQHINAPVGDAQFRRLRPQDADRRVHHQGGLHRAKEAGCHRQQSRLEHQPDLPPHQQHRALL